MFDVCQISTMSTYEKTKETAKEREREKERKKIEKRSLFFIINFFDFLFHKAVGWGAYIVG